ncbi:MAG: hypothetical protein WCX73_04720 [Candidatus Pacearchaeota archaeon]
MSDECGLLNLASCIPQKIYEFFINIINAPISPLLELTKTLLTEPVNVSVFASIWAIVMYIISLFYGLLMLYSGFNFMISGYDSVKRAKAKEWFQNIFLMIVLIQASYFIYSVVIDINSLLTSAIVNMIDEKFFLLNADNIINIGLQFFFAIFYVLTLLFTVLFLVLRYIIVAIGVIFVPFAIFFYFIPILNSYGKLIFNFLGIAIFITFFDSLIFLACSRLIEIQIFENFQILVMISAFGMANILMFYLMFFSAIKSAFKTGGQATGAVASVARYFA